MNNKLTRYNNSPSLFSNRDEFLVPFSNMFDDFFNSGFPDLFNDFGIEMYGKSSYPKVDIRDTETTTVVEAELPGLSKDQVSVEIKDGVLSIRGEKQEKTDNSTGSRYIHKELKKSSFSRSFSLGDNYDKDTIDAKFINGILEVTLQKITPSPKIEESKKIPIK